MAKGAIQQGRVKQYDPERGLGEIETESGDVLSVHRSALEEGGSQGLFGGDIVEYRMGRDRFGRRAALEVRKVGWEEVDEGDENAPPREWEF